MFRKAKLMVFISLALLLPARVLAIGLGEIQLNSHLNEPLNAEIQLLQVRGLSGNEILVGLAPKADFEAAGVDRLFFLTSLKFHLELDNKKGPLIRVTTDAPVREPYLNFLLEVQWPNGRLLREYTLLMDLPTTGKQATAHSISGTQVIREAPKTQEAKPALDIKALEQELAAADTTPPVVVPKTPSTSEVKPAPASTASTPGPAAQTASKKPDTVAAKQEAAPAKDDVEKKAEAVAEAPTPEAAEEPVAAIPEKPASKPTSAATVPVYAAATLNEGDYQVKAGDNLWQIAMKYNSDNAISIQQTMLSIQRLNQAAFINGNINLLKKGKVLRMPSREDLTEITSREAIVEVRRQNVAWSGDPNGNKAMARVEQLDATRHEAVETPAAPDVEEGHLKLSVPGSAAEAASGKAAGSDKGSLEALQNELSISMEELDRLKRDKVKAGDKIAALNDQEKTLNKMLEVRNAELAALQASLAQKQQAATPAPAPVLEKAPEQPAPAAEQKPAEQAAPVEVAKPAPVKAPAPVAKPAPAASGGIVQMLMDNLLYIGAAVLAIIVLAGGAIFLRRRGSKPAESLDLGGDMNALEAEMPDLEIPAEETHDEELELPEEELELPEEVEAPAPEAKPETSDALGEADIYISFGTYDKAESLLKSAIASEPKRTDLRLKLLEVYTGMENLAAFDEQFEQLVVLGDAGANERAQEMRNRIPGASDVPLQGAAAEAGRTATADADLDLDLNLDLSDSSIEEAGGDLDFDLDLNLDEEAKHEAGAHIAEATDSDLGDLDFDLDLAEEAPLSEAPTGGSPKVTLSDAPTVQQKAVNLSDAPTVQQRAINISEAPTGVSPAVKPAAAEESLDLDLSALDAELEDLDNTKQRPVVAVESVARDAPTPANTALDEEFDFLADADEAATKLDLARAYIDMGDKEGAKDILQEVMEEGQPAQKQEAKKLLDSIG